MSSQNGFVKIILIIIVVILVLSVLKISLQSIFDNQFVKDNFSFVWKWAKYVWDNFLGKPVMYIYNFFKDYIWAPSLESWQRLRQGVAPRMFNEDAPQVPMPPQ